MRKSRSKVVVVGSLNVDFIALVERLPAAGETVAASGLIQRFGGKGANQAVAAARQGASVTMVGCVGDDDPGRSYLKRLQQEGISVAGISTKKRSPTGTALIAVDHAAENLIIVAAGANGDLRPASIQAAASLIRGADVVLLQWEVPTETVMEALRLAGAAGVPVLLNPSPFRKGFTWGATTIDTLITNEIEAEAIFGLPTKAVKPNAEHWHRAMAKKRIQRLVITRGAQPTVCVEREAYCEVPALKINPIDTVGAGDAFAGTFAARRAERADLEEAIRYANCAGALATLKPGAQESIPSRAATERAYKGQWASG